MSFYIPKTNTFNGLTFVHIPKTGGSSIMLAAKSYFWETLIDVGHAKITDPVLPKYFSFAVFRDPYERAVSFYNEIYRLSTERPEMKLPILEIVKNKNPVQEYHKGFNYFIENYFTAGLPHPDNPDILVSPCQSQLSFISKDGKILVDCLLDFDNLDIEWAIIEEYTGKKLPLTVENAGNIKLKDVTISNKSKEIIEHYYKEDIKFYQNWKK
jgi:hypothetical protein